MNTEKRSVRDALFENPGPKAKRAIAFWTVISLAAIAFFIYKIIALFADNGQLDARYWSFFGKATTWQFLGKGLLGTLEVALAAGVVTFLMGLVFMMARISRFKVLQVLGTILIEFTRGVPTLLFVYFFFLVAPQLGINLPSFWRIVLPVAISASGVVAEVLRSGINAVPKGQREAALALGMREHKIFFKVVFPQAIRFIIPALIAELVIVLKDTTFAYIVNFPDLMQDAKVLISNYDALLSTYLVIAVIYILINYALNKLAIYVERKTGKKLVAVK